VILLRLLAHSIASERLYNLKVDHSEARSKARRFSDTAFSSATEAISNDFQKKLVAMRANMSARGLGVSGPMVSATAELHGQRIKSMLQARLDALLEGYELYGVPLDEQLESSIIKEIMSLRDTWVAQAKSAAPTGIPQGMHSAFAQAVAHQSTVSVNSVKVQVERRRLMPKKTESQNITIFHLEGANSRVNMNSHDQSLNVVTTSGDQIFTSLRQKITSDVPAGDERDEILERLTQLEKTQNSPTFAQRYTEFISVAANHMALIAPFIPALTEMLNNALKVAS
jgi:hypothetical protein